MEKQLKLQDLKFGDLIFKNTEMDDTKKNFFMRIINEITTFSQNVTRKEKREGDDHTEYFHWLRNTPRVTSSVFGKGVRTMNFYTWMREEDYPDIVILRRKEPLSLAEEIKVSDQIAKDEGLPYALRAAIKARFTDNEEDLTDDDLAIRGLFCSETTGRYAGISNWEGNWPMELRDILVSRGYYIIFDSNCYELL